MPFSGMSWVYPSLSDPSLVNPSWTKASQASRVEKRKERKNNTTCGSLYILTFFGPILILYYEICLKGDYLMFPTVFAKTWNFKYEVNVLYALCSSRMMFCIYDFDNLIQWCYNFFHHGTILNKSYKLILWNGDRMTV